MELANKHYIWLYYTVDGEPFDDYLRMEYDRRFLDDRWSESAAADCARNYYSDHDGWERSDWSNGVKFTLWRGPTDCIGTFSVVMEMEPSFSGYALDEADA